MKSHKLFLYFYTPRIVKKSFLGIVLFGLFQSSLAAPKITRLASDPYGEITTPLLLSKDGTIVVGKIGEHEKFQWSAYLWPVCFWKNGLIAELKASEKTKVLDLQYHEASSTITALGRLKNCDDRSNRDYRFGIYAWKLSSALKGKKDPFFKRNIHASFDKINYWISPEKDQSCFLFNKNSFLLTPDSGGIESQSDPFKKCIGPKDTLIKYDLSKEGLLSALVETLTEFSNYNTNTTSSTMAEKNNDFPRYCYRFLMYDLQSRELKTSAPFEIKNKDQLLNPTTTLTQYGIFLSIPGENIECFFWDQEPEHPPISLNFSKTLPSESSINGIQPAFFGKSFVLCFSKSTASERKYQQLIYYWNVERNQCDHLFTLDLEEKDFLFKTKIFGNKGQILYLECPDMKYAEMILLPEPSATPLHDISRLSLNAWMRDITFPDQKFFKQERMNCYLIDATKVDDPIKHRNFISFNSGTWLVKICSHKNPYPYSDFDMGPNYYVLELKEAQK